MLEFPSTELVKPYKVKATYMMAYVNLLGGIGLIIGEQMMIIPLAIVHLFQAFLKHNPFPVDPKGAEATYDTKMRTFAADMVIFAALIICLLDNHPLAGGPKKSTKVQSDKLKK